MRFVLLTVGIMLSALLACMTVVYFMRGYL